MLDDVVTETAWTKFQGYARRVRELHLGEINRVHPIVWITLTRFCPHEPLLPHLERLMGFTLDSSSPCYTMLFSPTIRHLEMKIDRRVKVAAVRMVVQVVEPILQATSLRTLFLEDEAVSFYHDRPPAIEFWKLATLHTLNVAHETVVTTTVLHSLLSISNLHSLSLKIKDVEAIPGSERVVGFLRLRELSLSGDRDDVTVFLTSTAPPNLDTLIVNIPNVGNERSHETRNTGSLDALFAALPPTLRHLRMTLVVPPVTEQRHFPEGGKLLDPLRALSGLRTLVFSFDNAAFHLSDAHLAALEDAWPDLVVFEVRSLERHNTIWGGRVGRHVPPQKVPDDHPTIKTLAAFAERHSHLERLVVPSIDLDALPDLASVPLLGHGLRFLGMSTLERGVPLFEYARALDRLFPRLDLADARRVIPGSNREDELRLLLAAMKAGREASGVLQSEEQHTEGASAVSGIRLIPQGRRAADSARQRARVHAPCWPSPGSDDLYEVIPPPMEYSESEGSGGEGCGVIGVSLPPPPPFR